MALLLSGPSFESFYGDVMHLTCESYLGSYRNDFSFMYAFALAREGITTILYMPAWKCRGLHEIDHGVFVRFLPLASWFALWTRFAILSKTPIGRYVASYANIRAFAQPLWDALLYDKVDVLYVQEYWTARFDYLALRSPVSIIGADHGGKRRRQLALLKTQAFRRALAITCQTEDECASVSAFDCTPILLRNGVDTTFYAPSIGDEREMTLFLVARLTDSQKRISDLIKVMLILPEPWKLQIAGSGPDEHALRLLSKSLGLDHRVSFVGFVSDRVQLRKLYRRCGVFCMPSANEGMPLAALEAMSCECALVVTSIRAFEELVEEGKSGFKVPVGDLQQLAGAICKAWEQRASLGAAARQTIEREYSLSVMAARLAELVRYGAISGRSS